MRADAPSRLRPLEITVHQDVLCSWCYLAELRLEQVRRDFGPLLRWNVKPFPLHVAPSPPSERQRQRYLRELMRARREPDAAAAALSPELWCGPDTPASSLPALTAVQAVRGLDPAAGNRFARMLQRVALLDGVNVSRTDVLFELVGQLGIDGGRFERAWQAPEVLEEVLDAHRHARSRGVRRVPTLVVGGRWMIAGLREVPEYRELILSCLEPPRSGRHRPTEQALH
ncbi:MAG TPA: DsbA family protein [Myxococcaceae bacterium]|nr:DsbA family protein [Myxococcaceae bacterium]